MKTQQYSRQNPENSVGHSLRGNTTELLSPAQRHKDLTVILDKDTLSPILSFGCAAEREKKERKCA